MLYSPLVLHRPEFRLLKVFSRQSSAKNKDTLPQAGEEVLVCCELSHAYRDDEPRPFYEALSYTWGDPNIRRDIIVNEHKVSVTSNLCVALEHIRDEYIDIILWVDALCINQEDNEEKGHQVQQMRDIYRNPYSTIVWLGTASDNSDLALNEIQRIGKILCEQGTFALMIEMASLPSSAKEAYLDVQKKVNEHVAELHSKAFEELLKTIEFLKAFNILLSREYWSRIWIRQEFVISPAVRINCGSSTVLFEHFHATLLYVGLTSIYLTQKMAADIHDFWEKHPGEELDPSKMANFFAVANLTMSPSTTKLFGMRRRYQLGQTEGGDNGNTLIRILTRVHVEATAKASFDKDLVFGLLGMADDVDALSVKADYTSTKTCTNVFTDVAKAIIQGGHVDLLSLSQNRDRKTDAPSWVPEWRERILQPSGQLPWETSFNACGTKSFTLPAILTENPAQITLRGFTIDTLEVISDPWLPSVDDYKTEIPKVVTYFNAVGNYNTASDKKLAETSQDPYPHPEDRHTAYYRVPVADQEQYGIGFIRRSTLDTKKGFEDMLEKIQLWNQGKLPERENEKTELQGFSNMIGWQRFRRVFLSVKGFVGLVPDHSEVGDRLVIFEGGKFVYILRKKGEGWMLIGEGYVHGVMYGEFVEGKDNEEREEFILL